MSSARQRLVESFRRLDPNGTGSLPRPVFESVMREVCQSSPAWMESLDFALARMDGGEIRYEDFFKWVYGESAGGAQTGPTASGGPAVEQVSAVHPAVVDPSSSRRVAVSYNDKGSLRNILCSKDVQLIKPEYFVYLHTHGLRMPKCQDVPKEWVLDVDVELDWGSLEIISVSYCWIAKHHPDPEGYHLQTLFHLCSPFVAGSPHTAKDRYHWSVGDLELNAPAEYFMDQGYCFGSGDGRPAGVFIDWMSIPQDQPKGTRTTEETVVFKRALKNVNIWYGHKETMTWRLTSLPSGVQRAGYDASGWPTFERCIAGIISGQHRMLLIDDRGRNDLKTAGGDYMQLSLDFCDRLREAPITPEAFNELVQDKIFTEGSDKDEIVIPRYRDTFKTTIGDATELQMMGLGFGDPQAREIMKLVRAYGRVKSLNLTANSITVPLEDWAALALDVQLTFLDLGTNCLLSGDIQVMQPLVNLTVLKLYNTNVNGDIGALRVLVKLTFLSLYDTQVTGDIMALQPLVKLSEMYMSNTQVTGDIGALQPLVDMTVLQLHNTKVKGDIRAVQNLVEFTDLRLHNTQVTGDIKVVEPLLKLTHLEISHIKVTGDIKALHPLVNLTALYLHDTKVNGDIGALRALVKLTLLSLNDTQVTGDIMALQPLAKVSEMYMFNTQVTGDIRALQPLVDMTVLQLHNTQVTGDIESVGLLVNLSQLWLSATRVSGDIHAVHTLVNMTELVLDDTQVTGDIEAVQPLVKLTALSLPNTQVTGNIRAVESLVKLNHLELNDTEVFGDVRAVQPLVELAFLNLSNTQVSGDIQAAHAVVENRKR